ncbi:MAG: oligosaccharide flippase family protein [Flavobacteriaceae bacterium]|nr:oligosaccharide flippase family protein [Flavobacteriaceae bacterium]
MKRHISDIKTAIKNNIKVIENYSFMTVLQVVNVLIGLITYPYVLKILGSELYGLYIFVFSSSILFGTFINFSTDLLGTKEIAQNIDDLDKKSAIVSSVVFVRLFLFGIAVVILLLLSLVFPFVAEHFLLYLVCFLGNLSSILFHPWYFQGVQKMKIVTYIQVGFKLLSLPFIFLLINSENDFIIYVVIMLLSGVLGALYAFFHLLIVEKIKIVWVGIPVLKHRVKISLPFFYTTLLGVLKEQAIPQITGVYFGMHEVALYDLAQKIIKIPLTLILNVNRAIFPKLAQQPKQSTIDKLLKYEWILGLSIVIIIAIFGQFVINILGGEVMRNAYYILLILSVNIITYLLLGLYLWFVFVLNDRNELLFRNQIMAFISFFAIMFIGLLFYKSIYVLVSALALSGIAEVLYCHWNFKKIRKKKLT